MIVGSSPSTPSIHILITPRRRRVGRHSSSISVASREPLFRTINAPNAYPVSAWAQFISLLVAIVNFVFEDFCTFVLVLFGF
jgi:hypothetical protein